MFGIDKDFQNLMEQVYGPLNKDKEPPDTIEFGGVKYKRVEDTQPFYDKLWGLLKTKLGDSVECDDMADKVRDLIREHIPEPVKNNSMSEYLFGYNEAIREVKVRLFNGIQ
jgi:hypothetical protein